MSVSQSCLCSFLCNPILLLLLLPFFYLFVYLYDSRSLFYIDTGDAEREEAPKIYSSAMDGSAQTVIVTDELVRPLYIAVDNNGVNGRIFWTDYYYNHIMTATFAGQNPQTITGEFLGLEFRYSDDSCPSQLQSSAGDLQLAGVEGQTDGKLCSPGEGGTDGKDLEVCMCMCASVHCG